MIKDTLQNLRQRVGKMFEGRAEEMDIPSEKTPKSERVEYVKTLYNDSLKWRKKSLEKRFKSYNDPVDLWRDARKLSNGQHWDVWGHRVEVGKQTWMHEITRPIIEQQLGIRKTYLTSNVHDVVLFPNVANLNEIIRQERDDTEWGKFVTEIVGRALVDGTAVGKEILDKSEYTDGMSKSVVCDIESIFPTPYSTSFELSDGCWYLVDLTMQNVHQVSGDIEGFDETKVSSVSKKESEVISPKTDLDSFDKTKLVPVYTCYFDDRRKENIPFPKEEFDRRTALIHEGQDVPVEDTDNHEEYINGYLDWLENTVIPNTGTD
ncbi:MAG: hypothetical protein IMZ53_05325, partial [Thermoplasmata archaeon]|nr:hypothetical protein [Thermoplasmata archaeon]